MRLLRVVPLHSPLVAALPVLLIYSGNVQAVPFEFILRPAAIMLLAAVLLWALSALALRSAARGAVIASLTLLLFWLMLPMAVHLQIRLLVLAPAVVALIVAAAWLMARARADCGQITAVLNTVTLCVALVVGLNLAHHHLTRPSIDPLETESLQEAAAPPLRTAPDIYYIILDGYARADVLEEIYGFDNSEFLAALRERGFYVAERSVTNYTTTVHSLASTLNMTYLDHLTDEHGPDNPTLNPARIMARYSDVIARLRESGYTTFSFISGSSLSDTMVRIDRWLRPKNLFNEFEIALLSVTIIPPVNDNMPPRLRQELANPFNQRRSIINHALDRAAVPRAHRGPVFAYMHILCPHPPFVFGPDGSPVRPRGYYTLADGTGPIIRAGGTREDYLRGFRDHTVFINGRILSAIDEIVAAAPEPVIIVLQSDHGPTSHDGEVQHTQIERVRERVPILNAYLVPDEIERQLYDEISPVNTFRLIFNYLGLGEYELLEDRSYVSSYSRPNEFFDVTDEVSAR